MPTSPQTAPATGPASNSTNGVTVAGQAPMPALPGTEVSRSGFPLYAETAHVIQSSRSGIFADRRSLARSGQEVGLSSEELAQVGNALLFHMQSTDKNTQLEAARALLRIIDNNAPFESDTVGKFTHRRLEKEFWKQALNENRDETFLQLPEVRSATRLALSTLGLREMTARLSNGNAPQPEKDPLTEIREKWGEIRREMLGDGEVKRAR